MSNLLLAAQQQVKKEHSANGKRTFVVKVKSYDLNNQAPLEAQAIVGVRMDTGKRVSITQNSFNAAEDKRNTAVILSGAGPRSCPIGGYLSVEAIKTKGDNVTASYFRTLSAGDQDNERGFIVVKATCSAPFKMTSYGVVKMGCRIQLLSDETLTVSTVADLDAAALKILSGPRTTQRHQHSQRGMIIRGGDNLSPMSVQVPNVKRSDGSYSEMKTEELVSYLNENVNYHAIRNALHQSQGETVEIVSVDSFIGLQMADNDGYKKMRDAMYHDHFKTVNLESGEEIVARRAGYRESIISIRSLPENPNFWFATGITPTLSDNVSLSGSETSKPLTYNDKVDLGIIQQSAHQPTVSPQLQSPAQPQAYHQDPVQQPVQQPVSAQYPTQAATAPQDMNAVSEEESLESLFTEADTSAEMDDLLEAAASEWAETGPSGMGMQ